MGDFLSSIGDAATAGLTDVIGTAATFGQGAVASAISGNPEYSNDPAAVGYAHQVATQANGRVVTGGNSNLLFLLLVGYVVYKVAK